MGLDIVEFVMGVEEAIGVRIPNDTAATLTTPRKLINHLHSQLPHDHGSRCLCLRAFYRIRHALCIRLGLPKAKIRPNTELPAVLPHTDVQDIWAEVGQSLGISRWPRVRGGSGLAGVFLHSRPRTMGEAARHIVTFFPAVLKPTSEAWSWREVASVVDGQMCYYFAIQNYSLDDYFVDDLGLD